MYPVLIELGHFELRSYGVLVVLAFFTGLWLSSEEAEREGHLADTRCDRCRTFGMDRHEPLRGGGRDCQPAQGAGWNQKGPGGDQSYSSTHCATSKAIEGNCRGECLG